MKESSLVLSNGKRWQMSQSNCKNNTFFIGCRDLLMFLINKALLTKTQSHGRWFLPSLHKSEQTKKSLNDFNCSLKCYSELHFSSVHVYFKTPAYFLLSPPSFSQSPWKDKIKSNKISIPIKPKQKKGVLFVWDVDELKPSRTFTLMFSETSKDQACYQHH